MRVKKFIGFFLITAITLTSCNSPYTVGKKRGYFAIDFPDKQYQTFDQPGYPYTFEYPVYAQVKKDSTFFQDRAEDWWINVEFPRFAGRIHISYKPIDNRNKFDSLVEDGYRMLTANISIWQPESRIAYLVHRQVWRGFILI